MMCPFCGEDLPEGASRCTRCQADLGGDDSGAAPEKEMCPFCGAEVDPGLPRCPSCSTEITRGEEDEEAPPGKAVLHLVECPRCETEVPAKRHRCPECGFLLKKLVSDKAAAQHKAMKTRAYLLGGGALALVVVLFVVFATGGGDSKEPSDVAFETVYHGMRGGDPLKKTDLKKKYDKKYITWTGTLERREGNNLFLRHTTDEDTIPEVKLVLAPGSGPQVSEGDRLTYTGKLDLSSVSTGGAYLTVLDGTVKD